MKILHIIDSLASGGAEKLIEQTLPLLNMCENVSADVLLLTDANNVFDKELIEKGVKVEVVPLKKIRSPLNIIYIIKYIIKGNYDVVHAHLFPANYWVSIASRLIFLNKPKFVLTEHSTNNKRRRKFYFRPIEKFIYSKYDCIISINDKVQKNLIDWIRPNESEREKYKVIKNGVSIDKFRNAIPYNKEEINKEFNDKTKLICMVGRFVEAKDQPTLIRAMKKIPSDVHLLLIGEGPLREKSETIVKEIGIEDRVHFLGFRNDVERILKTCNIVILSSHWEGLSLASIEGMASGRPFVASRVQGLEEIVNGHGLLFEQGNENELSKLIKELLDNQDFCKEISDRCTKRAEMYDINNMVKKILSTYKSLLSQYTKDLTSNNK